MKKKQLLLSAMMVLIGTGVTSAQKAYTYVQQDGKRLTELGTAAFDLSAGSKPTVEFDANGKAVMKIGTNTVAVLPMSDNGQLVVEFETTVADANLNKVSRTVSSDGFATLYSPFQLVPGESYVEVFAPLYADNKIICNDAALIQTGQVIPVGTGLLLMNDGDITFTISGGAAIAAQTSALSGTALNIDKESVAVGSGNCLYTFGRDTTDSSLFGFHKYTGTNKLKAGHAFLVASVTAPDADGYIAISFGYGITDVNNVQSDNLQGTMKNCKYIENGRVVIIKNNKKYNLNGQEVK